jgi:cystathionine beta-synthase
MFNDDWMRERGFLDEKFKIAADLIKHQNQGGLISVKTEELVSHAIERMRKYEISQLPVMDAEGFVGSLDESQLFRLYFEDKDIADKPIKEVMSKPYPIVNKNVPLEKISALIHKNNQAVIVDAGDGNYHMITKHDIISVIH